MKVQRNCTLDVNFDSNWCQEEKGCEKCQRSGCNTENVRHTQCLRCQSDISGECNKISDPNRLIEQCDHLTYSYEKRGCYTTIKGSHFYKDNIFYYEWKKSKNLSF